MTHFCCNSRHHLMKECVRHSKRKKAHAISQPLQHLRIKYLHGNGSIEKSNSLWLMVFFFQIYKDMNVYRQFYLLTLELICIYIASETFGCRKHLPNSNNRIWHFDGDKSNHFGNSISSIHHANWCFWSDLSSILNFAQFKMTPFRS